jgi:cytochrome b6-f complex iron-sulfur subunit
MHIFCKGYSISRRRFLGWMSVGALASSLPVVIAACSSSDSSLSVSSSPQGFQEVGNLSELNKGSILVNQGLSKGPVLIARDPANLNALIAVNPTCTHAGCTVNWQASQKAFVCPCHGSKFNPNGEVMRGPAAKRLATYEAKIEGTQVLVNQG